MNSNKKGCIFYICLNVCVHTMHISYFKSQASSFCFLHAHPLFPCSIIQRLSVISFNLLQKFFKDILCREVGGTWKVCWQLQNLQICFWKRKIFAGMHKCVNSHSVFTSQASYNSWVACTKVHKLKVTRFHCSLRTKDNLNPS